MSYMNFENTRGDALKILDNFINKEIFNYNLKRNFDYGPNNRKNVSCLSPYITHRLITEYEIVNKVLKKHSYQKVEKFIQEIFWRIYWKGWLELRPKVWEDFLEDVNSIENNKNILKALNGETEINCFNNWVNELKENNYLHNHSRMWFASIWIFTLKLPWQKGAEFFMQHLFDGDAASNTLGWRWVAGVQTQGKHYLAREWNIKKFTNNRFQNIKLNESAPPKISEKSYQIIKQDFNNSQNVEEKNLLIFENNLSFEITDFKEKNFKKIYLVHNKNENRSIKLSEKLVKFKSQLKEDQEQRLKEQSIDCQIINISEIKNIENCCGLYPTVGENLDFINSKNLKIDFLYRNIDQLAWQYCNKGFFNFKNYIPKIISTFN